MLPSFFSFMKQSKEKYKELLLNDKWHEKRAKVFKRDGFRCQRCGANRSLNCHHTYYVSGKKPWEYPLSALLTLCRDCHTRLHSETRIQVKNPKNKAKNGGNKNQRRTNKLYASITDKEKAVQKRYDALR
jgi:5-methylcytosine-specific restriction endonuclease McrA